MTKISSKKSNLKPKTLSIDIGGTWLKAAAVDSKGQMIMNKVSYKTPYPCPPNVMVKALFQLVKPLKAYDRVSIGFPGVVREGKIITAPHFGNKIWSQFPLAKELRKLLGKPVRILNDADMQGLAVIQDKGLELVVTLGTGVGTALFRNGKLMQRMELAQHPIWESKTYNEYIGDRVLKDIGKNQWNIRVQKALSILRTLLNPDMVYIGGGNSQNINFNLDNKLKIVSNDAGILGGINLWKLNEKEL